MSIINEQRLWRWWVIAILIGLVFRLIPLLEKQYLAGDEIRSYLAATAHEGEYRLLLREAKAPLATWAPVSAWTRFIEPQAGLGLGAVARDLAMWDVHPPLYFWLLHGWTRLVGVTFWAGALLNLLLEGLILALIVAWGRAMTHDRQMALWLSVLWWLHPLSVRVSALTRAYVLLTLLTLLFAHAFYGVFYRKLPKRQRLWAGSVLLCTTVLGLLTHYLFLFVLVTSLLVLGIKFGRRQWRVVISLLVLFAMALLSFIWIYPDFFWAFTFLAEPRPDFWSGLPRRLSRTAYICAVLYGPMGLSLLLVWAQQLRVHQLAGATLWRPIRRLVDFSAYPFGVCMLAVLPVLGAALFYLLLISPHHAMGAQYMNFATPFVALVTLFILQQTTRVKVAIRAFIVLLIVLNLVQLHPAVRDFGSPPRLQPADLATDGVVVFDNQASIHWFNLALYLDATQPAYVSSQQELLAHPSRWQTRLESEGGLYLSIVLRAPDKQQSTLEGQQQIVQLLSHHAEVQLRAVVSPLQIGDLYIYAVTPSRAQ